MQEHDQHASLIQSPRQLVIVVALAFIIPIAVIVLVTQLVTGTPHGRTESDPRILPRIQAFGSVVMADASGPKGNLTGVDVYGQVCKTCHEAGLAGAPKMGDKAAWASRIAQGQAADVPAIERIEEQDDLELLAQLDDFSDDQIDAMLHELITAD